MPKKYIIALILIFVGLVTCVATYPKVSFDKVKFDTYDEEITIVSQGYPVEQNFSKIEIDDDVSNINLVLSDQNRVSINENVDHPHKVYVEGDTLKIEYVDKEIWDDNFNLQDEMSITIFLKDNNYQELDINTTAGSINISEGIAIDEIEISTTVGNITMNSNGVKSLDIDTTAGMINITNLDANEVEIVTTIGDVDLTDVIVHDELEVTSTIGQITLNSCDSNDIELTSTTGNIDAQLLSDKAFEVSTNVGNVTVPKSNGTSRCKITTTVGNINVSILELAQA